MAPSACGSAAEGEKTPCREGLAAPGGNEPPVREESHLDDMRAAIRGDFERLAKRRGMQELMQEPEVGAETEPREEPVHASEPGSTDASVQPPVRVGLTRHDIAPEPALVERPVEKWSEAPVAKTPVDEPASDEPPADEPPVDEPTVEDAAVEDAAAEERPRRGFFARLLGL
jgi:hypothetical protein